jgi:hypothetical protein
MLESGMGWGIALVISFLPLFVLTMPTIAYLVRMYKKPDKPAGVFAALVIGIFLSTFTAIVTLSMFGPFFGLPGVLATVLVYVAVNFKAPDRLATVVIPMHLGFLMLFFAIVLIFFVLDLV